MDKYGWGCIACESKWCIGCATLKEDKVCSKCGSAKKHYEPRAFCPQCGKPLTKEGEKLFVLRLKSILGEDSWPY